VTATASTAPANRIDPNAVFLNGRLIFGVIYHADGSKETVIYNRSDDVWSRKSEEFCVRIELNTRLFDLMQMAAMKKSIQSWHHRKMV
jgi:hypothetical protein